MTNSFGLIVLSLFVVLMSFTRAQFPPDSSDEPSIDMPLVFSPCKNAEIKWDKVGEPPYNLSIYDSIDYVPLSTPIRKFVGIRDTKYNWFVDVNITSITAIVEGSDGKNVSLGLGGSNFTTTLEDPDTSCISDEASTETVGPVPEATGDSSNDKDTNNNDNNNNNNDGNNHETDSKGGANKLLIGHVVGAIAFIFSFYITVA